jgi:hypothetical protein
MKSSCQELATLDFDCQRRKKKAEKLEQLNAALDARSSPLAEPQQAYLYRKNLGPKKQQARAALDVG